MKTIELDSTKSGADNAYDSIESPADGSRIKRSTDINGVVLYEWNTALHDSHESSRSHNWNVIFFPFITIAQVEYELGLTASYTQSMLTCALTYSLFSSLLILMIANAIRLVVVSIKSLELGDVLLMLVIILAFFLSSLLVVQRVSSLRSAVRERFEIPGSKKEDRTLSFWYSTRVLHQIERHVNCDRATVIDDRVELERVTV